MKRIMLVLLSFCNVMTLKAQQTWNIAKEKDGIKVIVGEVRNSEYYAFKATMTVKATENEVVEILKDVNKYPEWFAFTASTKRISHSEIEQQFFMETDYPWPYSNECMNYQMIFEKPQPNKTKIAITGRNQNVPCKYSFKKAGGYILLESEKGGVKITYYFHSEPSQRIPTWLINPRIHEMPFQTFEALREKLSN